MRSAAKNIDVKSFRYLIVRLAYKLHRNVNQRDFMSRQRQYRAGMLFVTKRCRKLVC